MKISGADMNSATINEIITLIEKNQIIAGYGK
jgi:hypothetical protein